MKKGFTLIEILITITLIGALLALTVISIMKIRANMLEKLYENKIVYIEEGAKEWGNDNLNLLNENTCKCIRVSFLIEEGYITGDKNNRNSLENPLDNTQLDNNYICVKYISEIISYESSGVFNAGVNTAYKGSTCSEE